MVNEKRERFIRMFPTRIEKMRKSLKVLGNCSNKSNYDWPQDKVKLLFELLFEEYVECAEKFGVTIDFEVHK